MLSKKRLLIAMTLVLVIVFSSATIALAHGGNLTLIHACVKKTDGTVRIVGANTNCKTTENALHWGIVGPAGPRGLKGATGLKGDKGDPGELPVDPCAAIAGTYLENRQALDELGNPISNQYIGRIISLFPGGAMSVVNRDNTDLGYAGTITESQTDGQGTWTCDGNTVTARIIDFYRWDDTAGPQHTFEVDRIDWSAIFNGGVLTGTLHYCAWAIPVDPATVQTSLCASGGDNTATFESTRDFIATRITLP